MTWFDNNIQKNVMKNKRKGDTSMRSHHTWTEGMCQQIFSKLLCAFLAHKLLLYQKPHRGVMYEIFGSRNMNEHNIILTLDTNDDTKVTTYDILGE